jgi:hypothetical protein
MVTAEQKETAMTKMETPNAITKIHLGSQAPDNATLSLTKARIADHPRA